MEKPKLLVQLDTDPQPSLFDRVVAFDAGADHVLSYGNVQVEQVHPLVHGAIFTRSGPDLKRTALFVGGSDVTAAERLLTEVRRHMIPQYGLRVSVLFDANGANTTAAAAVQAIARHLPLAGLPVVVLGGTGPVGQRIALLLAARKADVRHRRRGPSGSRPAGASGGGAGSRCDGRLDGHRRDRRTGRGAGRPVGGGVGGRGGRSGAVPGRAGQAGGKLKLAVDVNAVPPSGIEGVEVGDKGTTRDGVVCYRALGVAAKMKLHRAAVAALFESNDQILDAEEVYALCRSKFERSFSTLHPSPRPPPRSGEGERENPSLPAPLPVPGRGWGRGVFDSPFKRRADGGMCEFAPVASSVSRK